MGKAYLYGASLLGLLPICSAPAFAQDATAGNADEIYGVETIVVSAERRDTNLQETPITISAFSQDKIDTLGVQNIEDVTQFAPNVEISPTKRPAGGSSAIAAFIRGVGTGDFQIPTDPAIGIYVDGVYIARTIGGLLSVADIERIEVLKGPQGTLFGRNTLGGAISVITTQPSLSPGIEGGLTLRAGSYGRADAVATVNGGLIEDKLGAKFSFATLNFGGWQRNLLTNERYGKEGRIISRGSLLFKASDRLSFQLTGDYTYQRQNGINGQLVGMDNTLARPARYNEIAVPVLNPGLGLPEGSELGTQWVTPDNRTTYETAPNTDDADIWGLSLVSILELSEAARLKSTTAYRDLDSFIQVAGDGSPYRANQAASNNRSQQFSQELELSGDMAGERLNYVLGLYYFKEDAYADRFGLSDDGLYEITGLARDARNENEFYTMDAESYAAFGQLNFEIIPNLELVAGARLNKDKKTYTATLISPQLPPDQQVSVPLLTESDSWTSFTPRLGVNYAINPDVFVYASYAKGFKSGGFGTPEEERGIPSYDPEELETWELGLKTQFFDNRVTFNLAGFYSDYRGVQITVLVPPDSFRTTQNGGDAEIYGFDLDIQARPVPELQLNASVGFNHARFTSVTPEAVAASARSGLVHEAGTPLPYIPDWSATAGAQYDINLDGLGRITPRVDWSFKSRTILTLANPDTRQEAYSLWNARLTYAPEGRDNLEISLNVTNLADKDYYYYRNTSASSGNDLGTMGDPRLIYGQVRYKF